MDDEGFACSDVKPLRSPKRERTDKDGSLDQKQLFDMNTTQCIDHNELAGSDDNSQVALKTENRLDDEGSTSSDDEPLRSPTIKLLLLRQKEESMQTGQLAFDMLG